MTTIALGNYMALLRETSNFLGEMCCEALLFFSPIGDELLERQSAGY